MTHSFPPRRSSDLSADAGRVHARPVENPIRIDTLATAVEMVTDETMRTSVAETETMRAIALLSGGHDTTDTTNDEIPQARICATRSEEHTSELQSLMRISYAVFCLKKKKKT